MLNFQVRNKKKENSFVSFFSDGRLKYGTIDQFLFNVRLKFCQNCFIRCDKVFQTSAV